MYMKDFFDSVILDMNCTESVMPKQDDVVSDENIICRLKQIGDLEQKDRDGRTLLINASCYARKDVVRFLLKKGVDVNARDNDDFTALHAAIESENIEIIKMLLEAGADINAKNKFGNSPLMICNLATNKDVFEVLISNGADILQKNNYGVSALDVFACSEDIIKILKSGVQGGGSAVV